MSKTAYCKYCNMPIEHKRRKFCSWTCYGNYMVMLNKQKVIDGTITNSNTLRKFMLLFAKNCCTICGISCWCNKPVPLVVDHIDGNPYNNKLENLRLICHNCDAQLPTYKGKNRGNGRQERMKRYRNGKSY